MKEENAYQESNTNNKEEQEINLDQQNSKVSNLEHSLHPPDNFKDSSAYFPSEFNPIESDQLQSIYLNRPKFCF